MTVKISSILPFILEMEIWLLFQANLSLYSHWNSPAQNTRLSGAIMVQSAKQNSTGGLIVLTSHVQ